MIKKPTPAKKAAVKVAAPAAKVQAFTVGVGQAARVLVGPLQGMVGVVESIGGGLAKVLVQGVKDNEKVDTVEFFAAGEIEANK